MSKTTKNVYYEVRSRNGVVLTETHSLKKAEEYLDDYILNDGEGIKLVQIEETILKGRFKMK